MMGWLYLAAAAAEAALALWGPWALPWRRLVAADWLFLALPALHAAAGILYLAVPRGRQGPFLRLALSELLFLVSLVFFLFAWIFALNANMDYVQRFFAGGGKVRLGLDTRAERLAAAVRYLPLLAADAFIGRLGRLGRLAGRPASGAAGPAGGRSPAVGCGAGPCPWCSSRWPSACSAFPPSRPWTAWASCASWPWSPCSWSWKAAPSPPAGCT
jgi:hypothetical protein